MINKILLTIKNNVLLNLEKLLIYLNKILLINLLVKIHIINWSMLIIHIKNNKKSLKVN